MNERTFTLAPEFGEKVFTRFSGALAELASYSDLANRLHRVSREDICTFLESAFWASLRPEEDRYHSFRLSLGAPGGLGSEYVFPQPITYAPQEISKLAPAFPDGNRSLGVWYAESGTLQIWGFTDLGYRDVWISANRPGQLLVTMLSGKIEVAVSGSWWGFVDKTRMPFTWAYLGGNRPNPYSLGDNAIDISYRRSDDYESIAKSMLKHGHGGAVLIVPDDDDSWQQSCSIRYEARSVFQEIRENVDERDLALQKETDVVSYFLRGRPYQRLIQRAAESLELVAQLTAVDGATIIGRALTIHGFGAKLSPLDPNNKPEHISRSRPFEDEPYEEVQLSALGGTRHQSAAQFVCDHKGCVAIVCSQDGRLSAMSWDSTKDAVVDITNLEYAL